MEMLIVGRNVVCFVLACSLKERKSTGGETQKLLHILTYRQCEVINFIYRIICDTEKYYIGVAVFIIRML